MSEQAVEQGRRDFLKAGAALGGAAAVGLGGAKPATAAAATPATLPLPDYEQWDATEIALRIRRGDVKPSEVLEAAIARAEAYAAINAVTVPHFDMARAAARALDGAGQQVFLDGQVGEAVPAFHDLHHAALDQVGRRQVFDALAAQFDAALGDLAALGLEQVGDGAQRGGLAGTVAAQDGRDLALRDGERNPLEHQDHMVVDDLDAVDVDDGLRCAHEDSFGTMGQDSALP